MIKKKYKDFLAESKKETDYWSEVTCIDFTEDLAALMKKKNISRAELAKLLGTSPAYITKVLRGNANFTIASMTKLARALGSVVRIHLSPEGAIVHWMDEIICTGNITLINATNYEGESLPLTASAVSASHNQQINSEWTH